MTPRGQRIYWSNREKHGIGLSSRKCIGKMMNYTVNKELLARLRQFIENEMRSCSMDIAGITPEYVPRMWGGTVSLEDIEKALAVLKAE